MNELTISLDNRLKTPLYEQIYDYLKGEILSGKLVPGERLPSTRGLCKYLQVSRSTVNLAYEQLLSEGYIESAPYRGYFISELEGIYSTRSTAAPVRKIQPAQEPHFPYDFALNGIDENGFPQNIWRKLSKEVLELSDTHLYDLGNYQGEIGLREAIVDYLYHARGVRCGAEQIFIGAGNDYLQMLLGTIFSRDCKIAMENPTYRGAYDTFCALGYPMREVQMDESGMEIEALEASGADIAYVMPSHQFPMGTIMPVPRRMKLLSWAGRKSSRFIIEDDYDSEFRYKGKPIPALLGMDRQDKVIYLGTFSKSIAPSIRFSYMVLPKQIIKAYEKVLKSFSVTISKVDQKIMELFLREGYYERHLNRMRSVYRTKHDLLLKEIKKWEIPCEIMGENAGVHVVVELPETYDENEIIEKAKKQGVRVYGLQSYYINEKQKNHPPTLLLGYATLQQEKITKGMEILNRILQEEKEQRSQ